MTRRRKWIVFAAAALVPLLAEVVALSYTTWWKHTFPFSAAFGLATVLSVIISLCFLAVYCWSISSTVTIFLYSAADFVVSGVLFALAALTMEPQLRTGLGQLGMGHLRELLFLVAAANIAVSGLRSRFWRARTDK